MKKIMILIATFFNIGKFPIAPGTLASFVTTIIVFLFNYTFNPNPIVMVFATLIVFFGGIIPAKITEDYYNEKDPHLIVIDEVSGQMTALLFIPAILSIKGISVYILGFFIFRFFDIIKPPPVKQADMIKGGFGIMFDDILAGLYTLGLLHLILTIL